MTGAEQGVHLVAGLVEDGLHAPAKRQTVAGQERRE